MLLKWAPSEETMPRPDLPAPEMEIPSKWKLVKSPQVSEPNMRALQQTEERLAPVTVVGPLDPVRPRAQSLLKARPSSLPWAVRLVMVTLVESMTSQPSRSEASSTSKWSEVMWSQPWRTAPKWPPRVTLIPLRVTLLQLIREMSLSAWPGLALPALKWPPPSIVPEPVKVTLLTPSPQIMASWKCEWAASW